MTKRFLFTLALALALAPVLASAQDAKKALSHDVFFSLNDASPAARDALVAACKKYLTGHEGVVVFSAGVLAAEVRPSGERPRLRRRAPHGFRRGKAAHDKYQDAPRHKQFIEENQKNWKKVRVFDSLVDVVR